MKYITGFFIKLAYLLRLRGPANSFQRWLKKEHKAPRVKLLEASTPQQIRDFAKEHGYKWRKDATRVGGWVLPLDWVTHPEVFQAKLKQDPYPGGDGDCDDYHNWFAACLRKIPSVEKVYVVSSGYPGGGHTTCCYKQDGKWYHVNYKIAEIDNPNDIPDIVAVWGTDAPKKPKVTFYVFEHAYPQWKAAATGPNGKVPI
jgi:hypothetical protein